jgi:hypothetical protein
MLSSTLLWAGAPAINIDLNLDQEVNKVGTPVGLTVAVTNNDDDLFISKGFGFKTYNLEMRVIDPAGHLLLPRREKEHDQLPDTRRLPGYFTRTSTFRWPIVMCCRQTGFCCRLRGA